MLIGGDVEVSKLFRAYGLYNDFSGSLNISVGILFQSSFELTGYITTGLLFKEVYEETCFKALSSLRVI